MKLPRQFPFRDRRPGVGVPAGDGHRRSAFTLIEVILAISIATGILVTALGFYRQASDLRNQLLSKATQLSAVRQILDQLAADLRTAVPQSALPFRGTSDSLEFARAVPALPTSSHRASPATVLSDFRRAAYRTTVEITGTNSVITGITREESLLLPKLLSPVNSTVDARESVPSEIELSGIEPTPENISTNRVLEPLTDAIRFLQFQFWDGSAWRDSWTGTNPPRGLEVTVGLDPLPADVTPINYPFEKFRRIIYLPTGSEAEVSKGESMRATEIGE